jgi:hypothetical protein
LQEWEWQQIASDIEPASAPIRSVTISCLARNLPEGSVWCDNLKVCYYDVIMTS